MRYNEGNKNDTRKYVYILSKVYII